MKSLTKKVKRLVQMQNVQTDIDISNYIISSITLFQSPRPVPAWYLAIKHKGSFKPLGGQAKVLSIRVDNIVHHVDTKKP